MMSTSGSPWQICEGGGRLGQVICHFLLNVWHVMKGVVHINGVLCMYEWCRPHRVVVEIESSILTV